MTAFIGATQHVTGVDAPVEEGTDFSGATKPPSVSHPTEILMALATSMRSMSSMERSVVMKGSTPAQKRVLSFFAKEYGIEFVGGQIEKSA